MEPVRVGPGLWALSRSLMRLPVPKLVLSFTENYNSDAGPENGDPFLSLLCLSNLLSSISFNLLTTLEASFNRFRPYALLI